MNETHVEALALAAAVAWTVVFTGPGEALHRRLFAWFARLGNRPARFVLACGLVAAIGSALEASLVQWPEPSVHDEFSYLLAAETFAAGRLTNPPHPLWEHFESFHLIQQPTYMSKYPPAQGLSLALGIALAGDPIVGLWLQAAAMCSAIAWMLFGWLPGRWAVLGSIVALLRFGVVGYWVQSYWGGAVAATGGALVFGALPRILREPRIRHALLLATGLFLLANSRPFAGLLACAPAGVVLLAAWVRGLARGEFGAVLRTLLPLLLVLAGAAAWMAHYNARVVGDPLRMPYQVYDEQYARYPVFLWRPLLPLPEFRHRFLQEYALGYQAGDYLRARNPIGCAEIVVERAWKVLRFYFGVVALPLLMLPLLGGRPRVELALVTSALVFFGLCTTTYFEYHYLAPVTGPLMLLVSAGWRRLAKLAWIGRGRARALSSGLVLALLLVTFVRAVYFAIPPTAFFGQRYRAPLRDVLLEEPGRDLVLVSYPGGHRSHFEFVFNAADIDGAPIVWARDMGEAKNRRLFRYFHDRSIWNLIWRGFAIEPQLRLISEPSR